MAGTLSRLTAAAGLAWLALLFYISTSLVRPPALPDDDAAEALRRIKQAAADIDALKRQNDELKGLLTARPGLALSPGVGPQLGHLSPAHEDARRQLERGVWELGYAARGELKKALPAISDPKTKDRLTQLLASLTSQWESLVADAQKLGSVDGAAIWRSARLANLSVSVQSRISQLQNPADCDSARLVVCQLNKGCGFGCQIHHAAYCAIVAYATRRTLVLDTKGWRYSAKGWRSVFLPVSACDGADVGGAAQWKGPDAHAADRVISLPILDSLRPSPDFLPLAFPAEMSADLLQLHGNPPVWWIAQFLSYLMRFTPTFRAALDEQAKAIKFRGPIVGLHVRRTDKLGAEAQFHALSEYMDWAARWFRVQDLRAGPNAVALPRRVFLATDDKDLLAQARTEYPQWEVLGSADVALSAQLSSRYTDSSLRGVLQDIHFLAESDHLVCTFSSQVCRVAYELAQARRGDAASAFDSLDDLFYFGGQHGHEVTAVVAHDPPKDGATKQLQLRPGDVIGIAGNHWDGWSKGRSLRTGEVGLFPSYKVREKWRIVPFDSAPPAA